METYTQANLYELSRGPMQITFSNIVGLPVFDCRVKQQHWLFRGSEIQMQDTHIGQLITVTLENIPEQGEVIFTLILPVITVKSAATETRIQVIGITTHKSAHTQNRQSGNQPNYSIVNLHGTAQFALTQLNAPRAKPWPIHHSQQLIHN